MRIVYNSIELETIQMAFQQESGQMCSRMGIDKLFLKGLDSILGYRGNIEFIM